jgi:hypothetical protein
LAQQMETALKPAWALSTVSVEGLTEVNSSLRVPEIEAILADGLVGHEQALTGWSAEKVTIPELVLSVPGKTKKAPRTFITYSDVELSKIEAGTAEALTIGAITTSNKLGTSRLDTIVFDNIHLANIAHVIAPAQSADDTFYPLYNALSIENGTLTTDEASCSVGAITNSNYEMRPVGEAFANLLQLVDSPSWEDGDDFALLAPLLTSYARLVTSVKAGPTEISALSCRDDENTKDAADHIDIGAISIAAVEPGIYPAVSAQNIRATFDGENHFSLEGATSKALDFSSLMAAVDAAPKPITREWIETNERNLTPNFGGFAFEGLELKAAGSDPFAMTVAEFDLTLADYINGIPSNGEIWAKSIVVDIPPNESDEMLSMMLSAGLTKIDGSFRLAAHWNEAEQAIVVEDVSFALKDMGSVNIDAQLTNATAKLFSHDTDEAIAAGRELALKAINLAVVDQGIGKVVLAAVSGEFGADAEAMRPIYADLVKGTIIAYLADIAEAADLGEAVSQFVAGKAQNLKIGVTSKSENGIALDEFEAAEADPSAILAKINVTASAQ